jgi:GNAT superfamily N-acetyltransferase
MHTGLTAVSRSHRRRGLATALKVRTITHAQAQGCRRIITDNEENNPMYQLNLQLGFRPLLNFMDFEKEIADDTDHPPL